MSSLKSDGNKNTESEGKDYKSNAFTRFALSRPVTLCMAFLSMLVFGIFASRMLPLENFPGIDIPEIYVNVPSTARRSAFDGHWHQKDEIVLEGRFC